MAENHKPAFLFVGNHAALDLLNTTPVLGDGPVDLLGTYEDLVRWAIAAGLVSPDQAGEFQRGAKRRRAPRGDAILREVKGLREALRSIATSIAAGRGAPRAAVVAINASLRRDRGYLRLHGTAAGRPGFGQQWHRERDDPANRVIAPVARSILDLLTQADLTRIRKCENAACVLWFLDTSKNGARRWCSMDLCGNRMKVAAHYRRHRAAARANVTGSAGRPPNP